nr:MAG TPA: tail sheath protein [Caudoviricetes sp.]
MAGGTWTTQNKTRPGVYIHFRSAQNASLTAGERGVVTICEPLSWGPVAQVMEISAGMDTTNYTGYPITDPKNRFLREIFRGTNRTSAPQKVLLYRPAAASAEEASASITPLTVTAKYPGVRGNDISIIITELTDPADTFAVQTLVSGDVVDTQTAKQISDLVANDWVTFSGTGALAASAGTPLTGGADGTVAATAYTTYLEAIEPYAFDIMIYDGADSTVQTAMTAFVKRIAEEAGQYSQLVAANLTAPDSQYVINIKSGVTLEDGTVLTAAQTAWWAGGAQAGALYNQSLTYAQYPDAVAVSPMMTNAQYEQALQNGEFVLLADNGLVKIEQDINSLVTFTPDVGQVFCKNRVMRLCNTIANDLYRQFSNNFIGVVNNNEDGRSRFQSAIVGYLLDIQAGGGIRDFVSEDVQVLAGDAIDAIVVNIAITPVDAVEKIYMSIELN